MRKLRLLFIGAAFVALGACSGETVDPGGDGGPDGGGARVDAGPPDDAALPSDAGGSLCPDPPACDLAPPDPGGTERWNDRLAAEIVTNQGSPRHRGRDLLLRTGDAQWALAKFGYGAFDDDLKGENVDMWILRDCTTWEPLGTAVTTDDGQHATVEGVEDTGGWVFFEIPAAQQLGPGRHRIHFSVQGDRSTADQYIEVIDRDIPIVVTDVDGTLTETETSAWTQVFNGPPPAAQPNSQDALWALARRGYLIFYLTARPHWFHAMTHQWLTLRGYPPGLVHTTLAFEGALNSAADAFKSAELAAIAARVGHPPDFAVGNTDSDAAAYNNAGIAPSGRWLYRFDGDALGGMHFDDYAQLRDVALTLPAMCP